MTFEHVAMIPFMIDASHLSQEEAAERAANPALWAARRYGQPQHIFQAAAERHGTVGSKHERPTTLMNKSAPVAPSCPAASRLTLQTTAPPLPKTSQDAQSQQPTLSRTARTPPTPGPSNAHGTTSLEASLPSGSYFSTVLSPLTSADEVDVEFISALQRGTQNKHSRSEGRSSSSMGSPSSKYRSETPA